MTKYIILVIAIISTVTETITTPVCDTSPCKNGGECLPIDDTYMCECVPGYDGESCEINIDDCAESPCLNEGECVDEVTSYRCECKPGFEGKNCEEFKEIDDCAADPCENEGQCVNEENSYQCKCKPGFEGENCEINIDDCEGTPCLNKGKCVDEVNSYRCECKHGFEGENCEININDCVETPCLNEGKCIDEVNSYRCECKPGFEGVNCKINNLCFSDIDDCEGTPCLNEGKCVDKVNSYRCECKHGFEGVNCDINTDDCAGKTCLNEGKCVDELNSYRCDCKSGFEGKSCEINVDDCAGKPCLNEGKCVDEVNSYQCKCKPGYEGRNCEIDIDDCAKRPCLNSGQCVDEVNSYRCICQPEYKGKYCESINHCFISPCLNEGKCVNELNSYRCECKLGYEGDNCEKDIDECANNQCMNGGKCNDGINSYTCACPTEYSGAKCEVVKILRIELKSQGCEDKNIVNDCTRGPSSIKVNGIEYSMKKRGYNIAVFSAETGKLVASKRFDTHGSQSDVSSMVKCLNSLEKGQIVLVTTMDEPIQRMTAAAYESLKKVGAKDPLMNEFRGSFALIGYTGQGRPSFVSQNQRGRGKGPTELNRNIAIPYTPINVVLRPSPCLNSNWWLSFDKEGWSKCKNENVFITGFWRNALSGWNNDGIYKLEEAKCCPPSSLYTDKASDCKSAYWWSSLDKKETWSTCPSGYFLNGLYRTNGNNLHNIEEGWCCKPQGHPEWYDGCYYEDISIRFDQKGWSNCSKLGYYVTGVHRDNYDNWLHNIDKLKCCKMWTGA